MGLFFKTDEKYNRGFILGEYQGAIELTAAKESNGTAYPQWGLPEVKRDTMGDKKVPFKVTLGATKEEAIANLLLILDELKGKERSQPQDVNDYDPEEVPF